MSTERPLTPPHSKFGHCSESTDSIDNLTGGESSSSQTPSDLYKGHIFDIIYPLNSALPKAKHIVPYGHLQPEAVDGSFNLGQGASFAVTLQPVPDGSETDRVLTTVGGNAYTTQHARKRPKFVVYKTARIEFDSDGHAKPAFRSAMLSVLTELHALVHPPLRQHENVIDFLGITFGSSPAGYSRKLPSLVVEYAEHGTLAQLLVSGRLDQADHLDKKWLLSLDVARGLAALHQALLVHGDVKAENVLIFSHSQRHYIAKIADFGYSVIQVGRSERLFLGGTFPWKAPEATGALPFSALKLTDVYSFGLLVWKIAISGSSPFRFALGPQAEVRLIEDCKRDGSLLELAHKQQWVQNYLESSFAEGRFIFQDYNNEIFNTTLARVSEFMASGPSSVKENFLRKIVPRMVPLVMELRLMKSLRSVLDFSIHPDPEARDLKVIINVLESDASASELDKDISRFLSDQQEPANSVNPISWET